jgi:hypothetical protein
MTMRRALPVAGIAVLAAVVFWPALAGHGIFFQRDIHLFWYPRIEAAVRAVAEGAWPLWNPYSAFGLPMLADISGYQIPYPPTWLNLFLPPAASFKAYVLIHCIGAGTGLYLLSRAFGLSRIAAFAAAGCWTCSGPLLSTPNTLHHFAGLAWLPWVLLALDAALERPTAGRAMILGAAAGLQVLAGSGDLCVMTCFTGAGYAAFRWRRFRGAARRVAFAMAGAAVFAVALSAVQWLPTLAILPSSNRASMTAGLSEYWSLHPAVLADLVVPSLTVDLPLSPALSAALFESRGPFLACVYLGSITWALAALGVLLGGNRIRAFLVGALVLSVAFALGRYTPAYGLLAHLPLVNHLRYPVKYMIPASLFWSALLGLGVDAWLRPWKIGDGRAAGLGAAAVAGMGLAALAASLWAGAHPHALDALFEPGSGAAALVAAASKLRRSAAFLLLGAALVLVRRRTESPGRLASGLLALAVCADLLPVARSVNKLAPPELLAHRPAVLARLPKGGDVYRVHVMPSVKRLDIRVPVGWDVEWAWSLGLEDALWPPSSGRWGLRGSYDGNLTGLEPKDLGPLTDLLARTKGTPLGLKLLRLGNVGYVISLEDDSIPGLDEMAQVPSLFARPIRLFRVPDPLPRAYVVSGSRIATPGRESFAALSAPEFDPTREVLLGSGEPRSPIPRFEGGAHVVWSRADALQVDVEASGPSYLVLVEAYDDGWRAKLDGAATRVLRADILFRAVEVPAGRHSIEMRYRPPAALWGSVLSLTAVIAGLGYWEARGRRPSYRGAAPSRE